jgi:hypothetical protein
LIDTNYTLRGIWRGDAIDLSQPEKRQLDVLRGIVKVAQDRLASEVGVDLLLVSDRSDVTPQGSGQF